MIVHHTTGIPAAIRDILRTHSRIVADGSLLIGTLDAQGKGYRTRWADTTAPTDAELRSIGYSYTVDTEQPTPAEGEQVRAGPLELVEDAWRQTWIVEPIPPPPVPESVYGHKMRAELRSRMFGEQTLMAVVLAMANQMPEQPSAPGGLARADVLDALHGPVFHHDSLTIAAFASLLGLDQAYIDGLFIAADARQF
jgi:hypothetical protein